MVKLIRLTSNDDGIFKSNFDSNIIIDSNSSIALHNLTFESDYSVYSTNDSNNKVDSNLDITQFMTNNGYMENKLYFASNYLELLEDLQGALNASLKISRANPADGDIYSSYRVILNNTGKVQILYQYCSMSLMFHFNADVIVGNNDNAERDRNGSIQELMFINEDQDGDPYLNYQSVMAFENDIRFNIGNITSAQADNTDEYFNFVANALPEAHFSNGSGMFTTYLNSLVDHAGTSAEHGYGMGLSYTDLSLLPNGIELPNDARDYEIIVEKTTDFYKYRSPEFPNVSLTSGFVPLNFTVGLAQNGDVLIFERSGGFIKASIWNNSVAGGLAQVLFNYEIPVANRNKPLFPYIYVKGGSANCTVGRPCLTFDSLFEANRDFQYIEENQIFDGTNVFEKMTARYDLVTPIIDNERLQQADLTQKFNLGIDNQILRFLGFDKNKHFSNKQYNFTPLVRADIPVAFGFMIEAENTFTLVNSDSYVVELLNIPLDSYDASIDISGSETKRGKRMNILGVIPVNNTSGIIEYKASTDIFISMNNKNVLSLPNIDLRILDKNLSPIETVGLSVITLLIK
tara:strand:- start:527 stop:2248 length:1722 start_codon:yes stop_codon:yes gene_type:complete